MGKTSAASHNKYNAKAYDRFGLMLPKGQRDKLKEHAEIMGESLNAFIKRAIAEAIERDNIDRNMNK